MKAWSGCTAEDYPQIIVREVEVDAVLMSTTGDVIRLHCGDAEIAIERSTFKKLYAEFTRQRPMRRRPILPPNLCQICKGPVKRQVKYCSKECRNVGVTAKAGVRAIKQSGRHRKRHTRPKPTAETVSKLIGEWSKEKSA